MNNSQIFSDFNIEILYCDYQKITNWQARNNAWPWWRIYWNETSGMSITFNRKQYPILPDSIVVVPPNTIIDRDIVNPVNHFYIHVKVPQPLLEVKPHIIQLPVDTCLIKMIKKIIVDKKSNVDQSLFSINNSAAILSIVYYVLSNLNPELFIEKIHDKRIRETVLYINNHLHGKLDNSMLAKRVHLSRNSFLRLFKEQMDQSPGYYILNKRLDIAAERLLSTESSIDEIAEYCSFANRYYFSRMFKKHRGISPALYRNVNKLQ